MDPEQGAVQLSAAQSAALRAAQEGAKHGAEILQSPPSSWRRVMRSKRQYRTYGTLRFLLEHARGKFETQPTISHEITSAVLDFIDDVADAPTAIHAIGLRGLAWKEYANTSDLIGDLPTALAAARRSVEIYGESPALLFDETRARLVVSKVLRDMGENAAALEIAADCVSVFERFGDPQFVNMARMFVASVLHSMQRFAEALAIFRDIMAKAEASGDDATVATCLSNAAQCADQLGDREASRDFYPRALKIFEDLNRVDDANCVRWAYALSVASDGRRNVPFAISELYKVRAVFLSLGMNSQAARAQLDVVRLRFDADDDVHSVCADLVQTFTAAGMTQNALEALAYIREQANSGHLTTKKIVRVRTYLEELANRPTLLFARPRDEEG